MALSASTVWEFASGGSMNNGGGYVTTGGSTDYSLAAPTPVLSLSDVYHTGGSTTITSDTGGFTTVMIGNLLKVVSGTNATVGWYEIKSRTNTNNIVLDRSINAATNSTKDIVINVGGALAYGIAAQDTAFHTAVKDGNTIWYNGGNTSPGTTYTLAGSVAAGSAGTAALSINYRGYKLARGDACTGTYRPTIACGTYTFTQSALGGNWFNVNFTGTSAALFTVGANNVVVNCKAVNTGTSGVSYGFVVVNGIMVGCEVSSRVSTAFRCSSSMLLSCYAHDSSNGFQSITAGLNHYTNCVVDTCCSTTGYGISILTNDSVNNCTIRNCKNGIYSNVSGMCACINNVITDCFVGATWGTAAPSNFWDYNCFYGNTTPRTNVTAGTNDIATDPVLTGVCGKGTDGASVAASLVFTSASNPFADVTTSDYLALFAGTGTGIGLAVYAISSVAGIPGQLTLATDPTDASNNISSCTFGVVKGYDFTLGATSTCIDAALDAATYSGVTI